MLVLTRKTGESIVVGDSINITILEVKADSVKIGIEAPREMSIHRKEVYEAIILENKAAAMVKNDSLPLLPAKIEQ